MTPMIDPLFTLGCDPDHPLPKNDPDGAGGDATVGAASATTGLLNELIEAELEDDRVPPPLVCCGASGRDTDGEKGVLLIAENIDGLDVELIDDANDGPVNGDEKIEDDGTVDDIGVCNMDKLERDGAGDDAVDDNVEDALDQVDCGLDNDATEDCDNAVNFESADAADIAIGAAAVAGVVEVTGAGVVIIYVIL